VTGAGPYQTEQEAGATAAVRKARDAWYADPVAGHHVPHHLRIITDAIEVAGVELGDFDRRILAWLGNYEDTTCSVIAGMITRAHEAGKASVMEGAVTGDGTFTFTRESLTDVLTRLEVKVMLTGPIANMINAESMADAIITALGQGETREDAEHA
jgi:hypothetical protein